MPTEQDSSKPATPAAGQDAGGSTAAGTGGTKTNSSTGLGSGARPGGGVVKPLDDDQPPQMKR